MNVYSPTELRRLAFPHSVVVILKSQIPKRKCRRTKETRSVTQITSVLQDNEEMEVDIFKSLASMPLGDVQGQHNQVRDNLENAPRKCYDTVEILLPGTPSLEMLRPLIVL